MPFIQIDTDLRAKLNINMNHAGLLSMIYQLSKQSGWCYMKKETMANQIGITREGVQKALKYLREKNS